jgi:hypothetical protein
VHLVGEGPGAINQAFERAHPIGVGAAVKSPRAGVTVTARREQYPRAGPPERDRAGRPAT